jgi:Ca2+-binding EF-hand superfamily protein
VSETNEITKDDIEKILGCVDSPQISNAIEEIIANIDDNGDGKIEFDEFVQMMNFN